MKEMDYDEVYADLSEKHFENRESLMIDMEHDQLLGEDAFILDRYVKKTKETVEPKKQIGKTKKPTNTRRSI